MFTVLYHIMLNLLYVVIVTIFFEGGGSKAVSTSLVHKKLKLLLMVDFIPTGHPVMIITEFMHNGALSNYLVVSTTPCLQFYCGFLIHYISFVKK